MNKSEYLIRLSDALSELPIEEKENILDYYEEYFIEAGEDREEETVLELGSPQSLAGRLIREYYDGLREIMKVSQERERQKKQDFSQNNKEFKKEAREGFSFGSKNKKRGWRYDKKYGWMSPDDSDFIDVTEFKTVYEDEEFNDQQESEQTPKNNNWEVKKHNNKAIKIILVIFIFLLLVKTLVFGIVSTTGVVISFIWFVFGAGITLLIKGISAFFAGISLLGTNLVNGLLGCGFGFLMSGFGIAIMAVTIAVLIFIVPRVIRLIKGLFKRLRDRKSGGEN